VDRISKADRRSERRENEYHLPASLTPRVEEGDLLGGPRLRSGIAMAALGQLIDK
jgi:hypothetical protein